MTLQLGGISFPLQVPTAREGLLPYADPCTANALLYWQAMLDWGVGDAWLAAMAGQADAAAAKPGQKACASLASNEPSEQLFKLAPRLPLLCMWPVGGGSEQKTLRFDHMRTRYRCAYILAPPTNDQAERIAISLLKSVYALLLVATEAGGHDAYQSGQRVWETAGVETIRLGDFVIGYYPKASQYLPALSFDVSVTEREGFDPAPYPTLAKNIISIDLVDETGTYADAVTIDTSVG